MEATGEISSLPWIHRAKGDFALLLHHHRPTGLSPPLETSELLSKVLLSTARRSAFGFAALIDPAKNLADRFFAARRLRPYIEPREEGYAEILPADLATGELRAKIDHATAVWPRSQIEGNPALQEELYLAINFATLVLYRRLVSEDGDEFR
ncbi:hypothetical protein AM571_PA00083 (plasmid) [Rhizobium etli 8C-3]|uniref:Uncharacterized protein n=1 Tax=Rhizobium etli 8C-3 TaxID=538025 RepID=A0A1L5PA43_RHIET|nr:hypothetical protein [Rhizobium etli]APO76970.1 hypothetical protein AM571_PA00083 [Rhizobium etli 8C-3]